MANLDALTNAEDGASLVSRLIASSAQNGGILRFVDLCSGPGGFSEYILSKLQKLGFPNDQIRVIRAYGITLRGDLDFNSTFLHTNRNFFVPFYGRDGSGDLTRSENIDALVKRVRPEENARVSLVVSDGAFSCSSDEGNQEFHLKTLFLAEVLTMFRLLKKGGDFVVKVFELLQPFSVGLLYLLHQKFKRIGIIKPVSSRPANSERYIICQDLVDVLPETTANELANCLETLRGLRRSTGKNESSHSQPPDGFISLDESVSLGLFDMYSIVDVEKLQSDTKFMDWIRESNVRFVRGYL
ncbi:hypothetical protein HDU82_007487 [Entophlyctis luteolus]|nr:hypothetical protein HDU82_007487 [Entophlyctis luteolus]